MGSLLQRIKRKLLHIRLQPIRVFVFHQVSDEFDETTMWQCDWTSTSVFKSSILSLKKSYRFISLEEAAKKIASNRVRLRKYAVLTSDDGWASLKNVIPWLADEHISITLFLNPYYLDGIHKQERESEKLLTEEDIRHLLRDYGSVISVASHGWAHVDCSKMSMDEFQQSVQQSEHALNLFVNKVPFYAFTFGRHTKAEIEFLHSIGLIPVLVDGMKNYDDITVVHRECLDGMDLNF